MNDYIINVTESGSRLDKYIKIEDMPRSQIQRLIENGDVTVNGKAAKGSLKLKEGDIISVTIPEPQILNIEAEDIPLDIVYEDECMLVVNKPQGMVVHPAPGNYSGTLVNALMHHCRDSLSGINGIMRPGIVHRIDKDTSGLLLVAKNDKAHISLSEQIKNKTAHRHYVCVVCGILKTKKGVIDAPIGRHPTNRLKMAVTPNNSKNAVTHFEVLEYFDNSTLVACDLETGRTHQIRVHMAYIGHPVMGDPLYLSKNSHGLNGQALHAERIAFDHPETGKRMEFTVPLPEHMEKLIRELRA